MRNIRYHRIEPFTGESGKRGVLPHFLLDLPYLFYYGVVPSREAINSFIKKGGGDAGMSPSARWKPFEIEENEYWETVEYWEEMDIKRCMDDDCFRYDPKIIVKDWEILEIKNHLRYLRRSREKYEDLYKE